MSECKHDFFTVQSEDSRCLNCGETESSIQSGQYVQRIAELEADVAKLEAIEKVQAALKAAYQRTAFELEAENKRLKRFARDVMKTYANTHQLHQWAIEAIGEVNFDET